MDPASLALAALIWQGSTDIAAGRAERGPWQMNESRYDYVDDPTVAIDAQGVIAVAWVDQARKDVLFQRFDAGGKKLGEPVNVSRSPKVFSWLPRIAIDASGRIFVLWQEIIFSGGSHGGDILFARSEDGGRRFSKPENLSNSVAGDGKGASTRTAGTTAAWILLRVETAFTRHGRNTRARCGCDVRAMAGRHFRIT